MRVAFCASGVVQWSDRPNPAWLGNVYQLAKGVRDGDGDGAAGHPQSHSIGPSLPLKPSHAAESRGSINHRKARVT